MFHLLQDPISNADVSPCIGAQHQASIEVAAAFKGGQGAQAKGIGYDGDVAPTLSAASSGSNQVPDVVCIDRAAYNQGENAPYDPQYSEDGVVPSPTPPCKYIVRRLTPTECARLQGFPDWWCMGLETPDPTEEDIAWAAEVWEGWRKATSPNTKPKSRNQLIKWLRSPHSDAAEYKMWGNGIALPCAVRVMDGITERRNEDDED